MSITPIQQMREILTRHRDEDFDAEPVIKTLTSEIIRIANGCPGQRDNTNVTPVYAQSKFYISHMFMVNHHPMFMRFDVCVYDDGLWDIFYENLTGYFMPHRMRRSVFDKELTRFREALRRPYTPTPSKQPEGTSQRLR